MLEMNGNVIHLEKINIIYNLRPRRPVSYLPGAYLVSLTEGQFVDYINHKTLGKRTIMDSNNSLTILLTTIWTSLDDILLCLGVMMLSVPFFFTCSQCLHHYFHCSIFISQLFNFTAVGSILIFLLSHLLGEQIAVSLFGGFSVGLGYAMQPYIVSLLSGATYYSSSMIGEGDQILLDEKKYLVLTNGILYICAKNVQDNTTVYLPNSMFGNSPLKCIKTA